VHPELGEAAVQVEVGAEAADRFHHVPRIAW
jgi:hypothetical protein